jgi:glycosyltransferase involved in cell wall biosynthesis
MVPIVIGGPKLFLDRLTVALEKFEIEAFQIINPSKNFQDDIQRDKLTIARLDGVYYYKMTSQNFFNFIRQRKLVNINTIKYLPDSILEKFTFLLNFYLNRFNRKLITCSDALVFQSNLSLEMHKKFMGDEFSNKMYAVILNGVPTKLFYPKKNGIELNGSPCLVITASFRPHKRLHEAIKIINQLKINHPSCILHVIGVVDHITKENISHLNCDNVIFHGVVDSYLLPDYYASCDVGLSPSLFDPCPNSVVEMMACGVPVITTKESGASELVRNSDLIIEEDVNFGYMELQTIEKLPQLNIDQWCATIEKVIDNYEYYSEAMLLRVERELDIDIVASKYADFIKKVSDNVSR